VARKARPQNFFLSTQTSLPGSTGISRPGWAKENARDLAEGGEGHAVLGTHRRRENRFKTSSWDDAVVTTRSQVLEIAMVDHLPALVKATKPIKFEFRDQGWAMDTREVLLKADKVSVVFDDARAPAAGIVGAGDRGERGILAESN
jgi:hypothetical protein